ncbi:MAG: hypothetical protein OEM26_15650, partial [Saprospiraceae bacterium]|nr:hypothetical protein [Saprospiraceae bacterium]
HSEVSPGKDGMMIQRVMNRGTIIATNPADPFHLATQTCSGINIISKDGQPVESHGSCDAVDADGDIWWLTYSNKPSGNTWQIAGGTGKYKNMTGGGTTQPLTMNQEAGMLTISYEGSWKMN